jgi:glycosyltransferase involved in cell wall biosynthesis
MKKVCILVGYYPINRGGSEFQAYLLANELKKTHEVFYISIGHREDGVVEDNGFRIYTLRAPSLFYHKLFFLLKERIFQILRCEQPNFVYQRVCYSATGIASMHCKGSGSRMIWHIASDADVKPFRCQLTKSVLCDYIEKKVAEYGIKNADYIIAQTEDQNEYLNKNYGRSCNRVIRNFHPVSHERIEKKPPIRVVWIANIKKLKQPEVFIDICERFKDTSKVRFTMIGKAGPRRYQQELNARISRLRQVSYHGELPIEEVNRILAESHIIVNTSLYEGFPNTFIQAWMRKVPVISLNVDPGHMLESEGIGFHSRTFQQMIRDLRSLVENSHLLKEMGEKARRVALAEFSTDNIQKMLCFFR